MYKSMVDKVAVVTGAATGIGFEIANQFLQHDCKTVILLDINEQQGMETAQKLSNKYGNDKAIFIKCDVTKNIEEVSKYIFQSFETVDILVNNAGILDESAIAKTVDINVKAVLEWSMAFYEYMRKDKGGKGGTIINICSLWGYIIQKCTPIYQSTKFAVYGFTKSLGHISRYNGTGVRVIGLCPGITDTDLAANIKIWDTAFQEEFDEQWKKSPVQKPIAVGNAAVEVFLRAPSGTIWTIDGAKPIFES